MNENHDTLKHLFWLLYIIHLDAIDCSIDFEGCASHNEHIDNNDKGNSCGFHDSNSDIMMNFLLQAFRKEMTKGTICTM